MSGLGGTVFRRPVADVEAELAAAAEAERKAKHEARKELRRSRKESDKAAVKAKVDELKAKLHREQKAPRRPPPRADSAPLGRRGQLRLLTPVGAFSGSAAVGRVSSPDITQSA